jgi:hypothetical protein
MPLMTRPGETGAGGISNGGTEPINLIIEKTAAGRTASGTSRTTASASCSPLTDPPLASTTEVRMTYPPSDPKSP